VRMDGVEHPVFARHVVRFGRHGPERRTPQNIFALVCSNQIDQVRMAVGKLLHRDVRRTTRQARAEIVPQRFSVDFFAGPDY